MTTQSSDLSGSIRVISAPAGQLVATADVLSSDLIGSLEEEGFAVTEARDNLQVLQLLEMPGSNSAQVVLCALHDPQLSGIDLCRFIQRQPGFARVAVILVTETNSPGDFIRGRKAGAAYVICRPFSSQYCVSRVVTAARQMDLACKSASDGSTRSKDSCAHAEPGPGRPAELSYLPHLSYLPQGVARAADWLSDLYFFAKLASRHSLRRH